MTSTNRLWLLPLLFATTAQAALDLTPISADYVAQGITFQRVIFKQADQTSVSYEPPRGWSCRGGGNRLQLTPAGVTQAEASIQALPITAPQPLDEKNQSLLKEQFLNSLPPGSQKINLLNEEQNPVVLDNKLSYAVTASYQTLGETFVRSALFINRADTQLRFTITSRQSDFEKLQQSFRGSILSWHWVEQSPVPAKNEPVIAAGAGPVAAR